MSSAHLVMIIDDDVDVRESLAEVLDDHGYPSIVAANGKEALERLRALRDRPCLILLDLMMPVMDGRAFRAAQQSDAELGSIPVLIFSAQTNGERARVAPRPNPSAAVRFLLSQVCRVTSVLISANWSSCGMRSGRVSRHRAGTDRQIMAWRGDRPLSSGLIRCNPAVRLRRGLPVTTRPRHMPALRAHTGGQGFAGSQGVR